MTSFAAGPGPQGLNWRTCPALADLASKENATNLAQFGVTMIEGVEKVRLLR